MSLNFYKFHLLIENDETHPFEKWHGDYKAALERERKPSARPTFSWQTRPSGPGSSTELLKSLENNYIRVILVAEIDNYTSGIHGFGDYDDVPASDPFNDAKVEIYIDSKTQNLLRGKTGFILDASSGSYHERWAKMKAYIIIDEDITDKINSSHKELLSKTDYKHIEHFFKFQSISQVVDIMREMQPDIHYPVKPDEDREAYWQRIMKQVEDEKGSPYSDDYDASDDYWRHR